MTGAFFEGPEKKVELAVRGLDHSLRSLPAEMWHELVREARAEVLSTLEGADATAYLLSESTLIVYDEHLTMITCGRTELVRAAETLLRRFGGEQLAYLFYERKNEHRPELQPTTFEQDAARLNALRPGEAYCFGEPQSHHIKVFHIAGDFEPTPEDSTLEVLMHGPEPSRVAPFGVGPAMEFAPDPLAACGLRQALDGYQLDEHRFEPMGYSMNALGPAGYVTIHVTPETHGSYVSFETDEPLLPGVAERWVRALDEAFRPSAMNVVAFHPSRAVSPEAPGLNVRERVVRKLGAYEVAYTHLYRPGRGFGAPLPVAID